MNEQSLSALLKTKPPVYAEIKGNSEAPHLSGTVKFYPWAQGTMIQTEIVNLPDENPFEFHIQDKGGKYNPILPCLISNSGYSYMTVYISRFTPDEIIGKSVIIYEYPDDCGKIVGNGLIKR